MSGFLTKFIAAEILIIPAFFPVPKCDFGRLKAHTTSMEIGDSRGVLGA